MAKAKNRKRRKLIIFTAIVLIFGGLTVTAILRKGEPVITVQTEKVLPRNITELVVANGRIQPVLQVKISPEVSGEIIELPVKEGQPVNKGDLLLKIKPDFYVANCRSAEASYLSATSGRNLAEANLKKAEAEFKRIDGLFGSKLVSDSNFIESKTAMEVARAQFETSKHQVNVAQASLDRANEELRKTTIFSPLTGTVSKLNSQPGERVVGTAMMTGTEVMIIADLNEMEARVDIGEVDVVLIAPGQFARLEVDAFRDQQFSGVVTEIANSSKGPGGGSGQQEGTKFEVKIRINEKEIFRPGMSITAEVETRQRTNVLSVPIQSVSTRPPKDLNKPGIKDQDSASCSNTTELAESSAALDAAKPPGPDAQSSKRKPKDRPRQIEVVFAVEGDRAVMVPVKRGISDDSYVEIIEGLEEGREVVSGGYKAISRDLEDGKAIRKASAPAPGKERTRS
jgi:HlyD family secretion protein